MSHESVLPLALNKFAFSLPHPIRQPRIAVGGLFVFGEHMQYTSRPTLDRATGEMHSIPLGNWITVTELGKRYGVGPKTTRLILHHIGLLQVEGGRYRLSPEAVSQGLGIRHERSKRVRFAFDVLSPKCQDLIDGIWQSAAGEVEQEKRKSPLAVRAAQALSAFNADRRSEMTTQMQVRWLCEHFAGMTEREMALVIGVTQPLVHRYAKQRQAQVDYKRRSVVAGDFTGKSSHA
jgi:hypothetical protein